MKARFASSKTKLAQCLGISRQYLHEFFKLPDSPVASSNGMHCVGKWRKFIANHVAKVKGLGTEREKLQIALLRIRVSREELELSEQDCSIREEISREFDAACCRIIDCLQGEIERMPHQLAGVFAGKTPNQIFKLWQRELDHSFQKASAALDKLRAESRRKRATQRREENVIQFNAAGAR